LIAILVSHPLFAGEEPEGIRFVAPWPGSLIHEGPVRIAGSLPPGSEKAHYLLNGRVLGEIETEGTTFSGSFIPYKGFNEFEVRAGGARARLTFVYAMKTTSQAPFSFHQPFLEGECGKCHRKARKDSPTDASLCYECHKNRSVMYRHVHGPVAAGKCLICHDPHGSGLKGLVRKDPGELCTSCHDQPSAREHTSNRTRVCTLCHDPHYGMDRKLLRGTF
jgi:predicted CXXCH cytochrome family protein